MVNTYTLSTWSFKIKPSEVRKKGTEEDIALLPPATAYNKSHSTKRTVNAGKRRGFSRVASRVAKKGKGKKGAPVVVDDVQDVEEASGAGNEGGAEEDV